MDNFLLNPGYNYCNQHIFLQHIHIQGLPVASLYRMVFQIIILTHAELFDN